MPQFNTNGDVDDANMDVKLPKALMGMKLCGDAGDSGSLDTPYMGRRSEDIQVYSIEQKNRKRLLHLSRPRTNYYKYQQEH